jgi:hypothetical protein
MRIFFTLLLLAMLFPAGLAAAPAELYSGEIVVVDKGPSERSRAVPLALQQVLQKLSGLRSLEGYPEVEPALDRAETMLLTYFYRNRVLTLADGNEAEQLRLVARFAPAAVDELARSLQLPLWQPERPPLQVWLVVDDGLDRRIMPVEYAYVRESADDLAMQRGLPLSWPEPGPEGEWNVDTQLLWGGYTEDLGLPEGQGVMIAAARREGASWGVRINLSYQGRHWAWRVEAFDLQPAMDQAVNQAADEIAAAGSIAAADLGTWEETLTVSGLSGAEDYQHCLAYLQGIGVVERVDVVSARPGSVTFRLGLSALPRYLEEALASGDVLEADEDAAGYRLLREERDGF